MLSTVTLKEGQGLNKSLVKWPYDEYLTPGPEQDPETTERVDLDDTHFKPLPLQDSEHCVIIRNNRGEYHIIEYLKSILNNNFNGLMMQNQTSSASSSSSMKNDDYQDEVCTGRMQASENDGENSSVMESIQNESSQAPMLVAGGLQQYLIKNMQNAILDTPQPKKGFGSEGTTFHDMPDSLHLEIFSYLNTKEICRICQVCRHWYCIASDETEWKHRLNKNSLKWNITGHTLNPEHYRISNPEWTTKEIYLRCSPEVNQLMKQVNSGFHNLSNLFRSLLPKKTPRIAMFGPGLESMYSTSGIVRKLMQDTEGHFKVCGMFPGQFEGVGSGFTIKMNNSISFHLMTLYTATRGERLACHRDDRVQKSRLLEQHQKEEDNGDDVLEYEVRDAIKGLCRTVDAFIFVVDASMDSNSVISAFGELQPMIDPRWSKETVPLLVLSCTSGHKDKRIPCLNVAKHLRLNNLHRPWQVHDCVIEDCLGLTPALEWLVEQAQRV